MANRRGAKREVKGRETGIQYTALGGRQKRTFFARNKHEAGAIASRMFPRAGLITVTRKPSASGKEYETYIISR